MHEPVLINIQQLLIEWFKQNKRTLPWRDSRNPYHIWVSEIILQQTKVVQGLDYYLRFIDTFPTVEELAAANEADVLKLWQGLGYYSRARNLHYAAKQIMNEFDGQFPGSYQQIIRLKGVGDYTASAISSIAFGESHAVVDGNVSRVLARVFGIMLPVGSGQATKKFKELATLLLSNADPGEFNQAVMEFGALQCVPKSPRCSECTLYSLCYAAEKGKVDELPVKNKPTKQRERFFVYLVPVTPLNHTLIYRRSEGDVWQGLYEFPLLELPENTSDSEVLSLIDTIGWLEPEREIGFSEKRYKHVLSHQIIDARFVIVKGQLNNSFPDQYCKVELCTLDTYPVSRLTEKFLHDHAEILP